MTDINYPASPQNSVIAGRYLNQGFQKSPIEGSAPRDISSIRKGSLQVLSLAAAGVLKLRATISGSAPYLAAPTLVLVAVKSVEASGVQNYSEDHATFTPPGTVVNTAVVVDAQITVAAASPVANAIEFTVTNAAAGAVNIEIEAEVLCAAGQVVTFSDAS
jgi:hypothetical protein